MQHLSESQVRLLRLRAQGLDPRGRMPATVAQAVGGAMGLQAQDWPAALLGVRARTAARTAADVERALGEERSVVRTWLMRGTLHLVATEDYLWLLPLLGPIFSAAGRPRKAALGLDEATLATCVHAIRDCLGARGPQTRSEIVSALSGWGIQLAGQARAHALNHAALAGVVCRGPDRGREPTFVLTADWIGPLYPLPQETALAELARRYLLAFGPAALEDFAYWSGLPLSLARQGWRSIADRLVPVQYAGTTGWIAPEHADWLTELAPAGTLVNFIPAYDAYLLAYRRRVLAVDPLYDRQFRPGGGLLRPVVLSDGRAVGTWRIGKRPGRIEVVLEPFAALSDTEQAGVAREVADIGRFLNAAAKLVAAQPTA